MRGRGGGAVVRIVLVSCGKQKRATASPAGMLYTSSLFRLSAKWAQNHGDAWAILSAKHGLLLPGDVTEPYDATVAEMSKEDRKDWAASIRRGLAARLGWREAEHRVSVLAGGAYVSTLRKVLVFDEPLRGLSMGLRLRWLSENAEKAPESGVEQLSLDVPTADETIDDCDCTGLIGANDMPLEGCTCCGGTGKPRCACSCHKGDGVLCPKCCEAAA